MSNLSPRRQLEVHFAERTWEISDIDGKNKRTVTLAQLIGCPYKAMAKPIMREVPVSSPEEIDALARAGTPARTR